MLDQSLPLDFIVLGLLIYMLFKMNGLSFTMNGMSKDMNVLSKDVRRIDQKLDNHITDTNKRLRSCLIGLIRCPIALTVKMISL